MKQFRDNPGPGRDTIMAAVLYGLSDADLANLAHYLATFKP
jgi:cytochrome c553